MVHLITAAYQWAVGDVWFQPDGLSILLKAAEPSGVSAQTARTFDLGLARVYRRRPREYALRTDRRFLRTHVWR